MSEIKVQKGESLDSALRRFKRSCQKAGVLSEVRKREHYEKPSVKRKDCHESKRRRPFGIRRYPYGTGAYSSGRN